LNQVEVKIIQVRLPLMMNKVFYQGWVWWWWSGCWWRWWWWWWWWWFWWWTRFHMNFECLKTLAYMFYHEQDFYFACFNSFFLLNVCHRVWNFYFYVNWCSIINIYVIYVSHVYFLKSILIFHRLIRVKSTNLFWVYVDSRVW